MKINKKAWQSAMVISAVFCSAFCFAQEAARVEKNMRDISAKKRLEKWIATPKQKQIIEDTTFIKEVIVSGEKKLSDKDIKKIVASYENRELTVNDMEEMAEQISRAYSEKGYNGYVAYPKRPDREKGILEIEIRKL